MVRLEVFKDNERLPPNANQPTDLRVILNTAPAFYSRRQQRGLPIPAVDEPIFIVACPRF